MLDDVMTSFDYSCSFLQNSIDVNSTRATFSTLQHLLIMIMSTIKCLICFFLKRLKSKFIIIYKSCLIILFNHLCIYLFLQRKVWQALRLF